MGNCRPLRRVIAAFVLPRLLPLLLAPAATGCLTASLWQNANSLRGKEATAALLTPLTVAADAALVAGAIFAIAHACGTPCAASVPSNDDPAQRMREMAREDLAHGAGR